jgi:uncharacterized protein YeaO (DUF488 family)
MIYTGYYSRIKDYKVAGLKVVSISVSEPKAVTVDGKIPQLSPNQSLFEDYKKGAVGYMEYKSRYLDQLDGIGIKEILRSIHSFGDDIVLLCWEAPDKFCHRHILADYINKRTKLEIKEYE